MIYVDIAKPHIQEQVAKLNKIAIPPPPPNGGLLLDRSRFRLRKMSRQQCDGHLDIRMKKVRHPLRKCAPSSFFLPVDKSCDSGYRNIQRTPFLRPAKLYVEKLWQVYAPYADRHFREDARKHFLQRFWEMYLTVTLVEAGFRPVKLSDEGPEFFVEIDGRRTWFEAVAPEGGEGPDQVPEYPPGTAFNVPTEQVLLRYTNALAEKRRKYQRDLAKGIVGKDDGFILAINCRHIPHARYGGVMPYPLMAYLPFGPLAVRFDIRTGRIADRYFEKREAIRKLSGVQIPTTAFLDPAYAGVSAIIHSAVDAANAPVVLGADFFVLHNPMASFTIDTETFSHWRQYVFADDRVNMIEPHHSRSNLPAVFRGTGVAPSRGYPFFS